MPAPPYPWEKGKHANYTCFVVEVEIAVDEHGTPWVNHKLQSQEDFDLTSEMKMGGMEYVAHALLIEAVKREAVLEVLLRLSNNPEFKGRVLDPAPEAQDRLAQEVTAAMVEVVKGAVLELAPGAVQAALDMVRQDPPDE